MATRITRGSKLHGSRIWEGSLMQVPPWQANMIAHNLNRSYQPPCGIIAVATKILRGKSQKVLYFHTQHSSGVETEDAPITSRKQNSSSSSNWQISFQTSKHNLASTNSQQERATEKNKRNWRRPAISISTRSPTSRSFQPQALA